MPVKYPVDSRCICRQPVRKCRPPLEMDRRILDKCRRIGLGIAEPPHLLACESPPRLHCSVYIVLWVYHLRNEGKTPDHLHLPVPHPLRHQPLRLTFDPPFGVRTGRASTTLPLCLVSSVPPFTRSKSTSSAVRTPNPTPLNPVIFDRGRDHNHDHIIEHGRQATISRV